ncbi:MAG: hypothetical protein JWQ90_4501 [Hydrocarboniphaga sp.]|uniref:DUF4124 domain-containing protein n=1 Tax=Hydrocarboniphaga sp. TaxID=2033016 RepID=UPI0026156D3D|nr:DUF4124 domain-containing protein [Hydrocarboniphaga sp.]MDB5972051.1 hypothetical protein [Hydrocarboniphaga sp.]
MKLLSRSFCALWLAATLTLDTASAATAYRWTDADGVVHYAQTPPSSGRYDIVHPELPPPVAAPADDGAKAFLKRIDEQDAAKAKARVAAAAAKQASAQQCADARARLHFLDERPPNRLRTREAGGELKRMDADEWERQRQSAAAAIAKSCKP